jgi:hypothetical protein
MYDFFKSLKAVLRFFYIGRIGIFTVALLAVLLFCVDQVTDTIISIGNSASLLQFSILFVFLILLALLEWYLAMKFYSLAYYETQGKLIKIAIVYLPRFLGAAIPLVFGLAFMTQAIAVFGLDDRAAGLPLFVFGIVVAAIGFIACVAFIIGMIWFPSGEPSLAEREPGNMRFLPFKSLSAATKKIVLADLAISAAILIVFVITPLCLSRVIGNAITILVICICIYIPMLYTIAYFSSRVKFPLFAVLIFVIAVFSFFNGNKNVRILDHARAVRNDDLTGYFYKWYDRREKEYTAAGKTIPRGGIPMITVLSEGGGIRAAYYSGCLLARICDEYPGLSKYVFGIQGVSGGSFGAAVFDSLLKFRLEHQDENRTSVGSQNKDKSGALPASGSDKFPMERKAGEVLGQDYLSPVIMGMLTREVVQLFCPVPIESFDYAKLFEQAWETEWSRLVTSSGMDGKLPVHDATFGEPVSSLWNTNVNSGMSIPVLFLNSTNVESGKPFTVCPLNLPADASGAVIPHLGITNDFYYFTGGNDIRVSTAALLSARFPYIGPAGTIVGDKKKVGFVDGGYFDNTGANFANDIYLYLEDNVIKEHKMSFDIQPIVIYLKNGSDEDSFKSSPKKSLLYQLFAPLETFFNVRDAFTANGLDKMNILLSFDDLEIITLPLTESAPGETLAGQLGPKLLAASGETHGDRREGDVTITPVTSFGKPGEPSIPLPLGWALSKSAQAEIDGRIDRIMKALPDAKLFKQLVSDTMQ